jgi:hypothetical protein
MFSQRRVPTKYHYSSFSTCMASARHREVASHVCWWDEFFDDVSTMAVMFDEVITRLLDQLSPIRQLVCPPRPSDRECRYAQMCPYRGRARRSCSHSIASLQSPTTSIALDAINVVATSSCSTGSAAPTSGVKSMLIEDHQSDWRAIDMLLGRDRPTTLSVDKHSDYFDEKVLGHHPSIDWFILTFNRTACSNCSLLSAPTMLSPP